MFESKPVSLLAVATLACSISGCATIFSGTKQTIAISTYPVQKAQCQITTDEGVETLVTPATITVDKSAQSIKVFCEARNTPTGYQWGALALRPDVEGWAMANVGNLFVGLAVDAYTGAWAEYDGEIKVALAPAVMPVAGLEDWHNELPFSQPKKTRLSKK